MDIAHRGTPHISRCSMHKQQSVNLTTLLASRRSMDISETHVTSGETLLHKGTRPLCCVDKLDIDPLVTSFARGTSLPRRTISLL